MTLSERDAINRAEGYAEGYAEGFAEGFSEGYAKAKFRCAEKLKNIVQELLENHQITPETASLLLSVIEQ